MSKAHQDRRDSTVRRYLLKALRRAGLRGVEWEIIAFIMDNAYGWRDLSSEDRRRRMDRCSFLYQELVDDIGSNYDAISRAMRTLIGRKIVTEYSPPLRGKSGVYGINSDVDQWLEVPVGSAKLPRQKQRPNDLLGRQKQRPNTLKSATQCPEKPHSGAGLRPSNIDLNIDNTPPTPLGGVRCGDVLGDELEPLIATMHEAVLRQGIPAQTALSHAERNYASTFGQSLSPAERCDLRDFFDLSKYRGSLLGIWIEALTIAFEERQEMRRDPERQRYAKGSPYKLTRRTAGDLYAELKAKRNQTGDHQ